MLLAESTWAFAPVGNRICIKPSTHHSHSATALAASVSPVEKVAIIGSGIAGLSLAHALRSTHLCNGSGENTKPIQIDIFDSRSDLNEKSGSGIQLTGGMRALREISPELQKEVSAAALPFEKVVSTCRPWFGSDDNGWKLFELNIQQAIRDKTAADEEAAKEEGRDVQPGLVTQDGEVLAYTILRGSLQRILQDGLTKDHGIDVQFGKCLSGISYTDSNSNGGIECQFDDGSETGPYDLVVGCDGIQSAVKQYVDTGKIQSSFNPSAIYSGLRITFAIQEDVDETIDKCQFTQYFGSGAYALTSSYGAGKGKRPAKGAFLVYPDANYIGPFPKSKDDSSETATANSVDDDESAVPLDENADWTQDNRVTKDHVTECLEILKSTNIPGNDVSSIVANSDRFFDLGVYLHNPLTWNGWMREVRKDGSKEKTAKFCVTTGDAAHAMPPFLGQGANQALQE